MSERIALITGGNKGLGFETARRLKENRVRFYIGARQSERGIEAASLLAVEWLHLDVKDEASVRDAAVRLGEREGSLDVLVNNAGIAGSHKPAAELTGDDAEAVFATNIVGPVRVMNAFIPLKQTSSNLVIVNVSSGLRSFTVTQDTQRFKSRVLIPLYCASKSALNMLTLQYTRALPNFRVNAADPGYTATDLNGHRGQQTVEEGTDAIICLTTLPRTARPARFWIAAGTYFGKRFGEPSRSLCEGPSIRQSSLRRFRRPVITSFRRLFYLRDNLPAGSPRPSYRVSNCLQLGK